MRDNARIPDHASAYIKFFETLSRETLPDLAGLVAVDIRFRDPINNVVGVAAMAEVLEAMFHELESPRFRVTHCACDEQSCLLRWTFNAYRRSRPFAIEGMSNLQFDEDGQIIEHLDFWDTGMAIYESVPVLGPIVRFIRKRIGISKSFDEAPMPTV